MNLLEELGRKYGTDKGTKHNYLPVYYEMFKDKRDFEGYVVELGMGEGASLKMWNDFFPKVGIFGLDNEVKRVKRFSDLTDIEVDEWPRISGQVCDQSSIKSLNNFLSNTDLLEGTFLFIDDGSHRTSDQVLTFLKIFPNLTGDAVYVIEDVSEPELEDLIKNIFYDTAMEYRYEIKTIECGKRYDDRLIIVKHKNG